MNAAFEKIFFKSLVVGIVFWNKCQGSYWKIIRCLRFSVSLAHCLCLRSAGDLLGFSTLLLEILSIVDQWYHDWQGSLVDSYGKWPPSILYIPYTT